MNFVVSEQFGGMNLKYLMYVSELFVLMYTVLSFVELVILIRSSNWWW